LRETHCTLTLAMVNFDALDSKIEQVNARLKAARMGLQIERRGQKLNLRGTLPPRPGSDRLKPHQQRLSLNLPATTAGLKQAEQEVKVIAAELIQKAKLSHPFGAHQPTRTRTKNRSVH